jgi:lysophospholipase L1-like esterase
VSRVPGGYQSAVFLTDAPPLRSRLATRLLLAALCALALGPSAAHAGPASPNAVVVSMGDSYISGEGGRWAGNSVDPAPGNDGTDRACVPAGPTCTVDKSRVYVGGSDANGCHRSDVAEVLSARFPDAQGVNIACSGATTKNLMRSSSGGVGQNGELPEADQLLPIAQANSVRMIVVSIGGNDLGFASIVAACLQAYESRQRPCNETQQPLIEQRMAQAQANVEKVVDEIRAVMAQAGYADGDYRLVLQTYSSVIPRATEARYPQDGPQRTAFGCPFYDADMTWARDTAAPEIGAMVKRAAAARGVEVLDLGDTLQGHEICSQSTAEATPTSKPTAATAEWGRFLGASTAQQGDLQEAFHPNAYAQQAFGACLAQLYARAPGSFACNGAPGTTGAAATLVPTAAIEASRARLTAALRLSARRVHARRAGLACWRFAVAARGRHAKGAVVRFAGHRATTGRTGSATICTRRRGTERASASLKGFTRAVRYVHVRRA